MRYYIQLAIAGLLMLGVAQDALGQMYETTYRPPGTRYWVLKSTHFDVIYEAGHEQEARETAAILEANLPQTRAQIGVHRSFRMPVVLNAFNDRSNGYVRTVPFKQEIELPAIKGSGLSPRFSSWIETVAPHELAHAVHAEYGRGVGVTGLIRLFSPDLARATNLFVPPGIAEGIAVYRESTLLPGAGRLNHALFTMVFRAAMGADQPWNMAQLVEAPAYSNPGNRYYIGGAHLVDYLMADSSRVLERASNVQYRLPGLGYGINLWYGARQRPRKLGRAFRATVQAKEANRIAALGATTTPTLIHGQQGVVHQQPRWLDNQTLLVWMRGYNHRPGFYRIGVDNGTLSPIAHVSLTEDQVFYVDTAHNKVWYNRYVPDPFVLIQDRATGFELDIDSGEERSLTATHRVHNLIPAPEGGYYALANEGAFNQWVHLTPDGIQHPLTDYNRAFFRRIVPRPTQEYSFAVLLNVAGFQGVFEGRITDGKAILTPLLGFETGSVYDMSWDDSGRYLLFSADPDGVSNIYVYDTANDAVYKMTNVRYGALHPSLSPDGTRIAFVHYEHERYDLVQLPFELSAGIPIDRQLANYGEQISWEARLYEMPILAASIDDPPVPYRPHAYWKPRTFYPTLQYDAVTTSSNGVDLGLGAGLGVEGTDPLQRWSYKAEGWYQHEQVWGTARLSSAALRVRPTLYLSSEPSTLVVGDGVGGTSRLGRVEKAVGLRMELPVVFQNNVYQSLTRFFVDAALEREYFFDRDGEVIQLANSAGAPLPEKIDRFTVSPGALLAYRVQSNTRDLVPNTGVVTSAFTTLDISAEDGFPCRALLTESTVYLPWLRRHNIGLALHVRTLSQNLGRIYNLDFFVPRGYEEAPPVAPGTFFSYGLTYTQPLWYIDNGFFLLPLYFRALYGYGFAETMHAARAVDVHQAAIGGGIGLKTRLFYYFDFDIRIGASYRFDDQQWDVVFR